MDERPNRSGRWNRLKMLAVLAVLTCAVTLAVIVAERLSDESLAVLAGAVCGVGAAIPTSLLVVAVSRRRRDEPRVQPSARQGNYPPVVVVTPPAGWQRANGWDTLPPSLTAPVQRNFTVVGGASADVEERTWPT